MEISVNQKQGLFVLHFTGGCTTMGFDNVFKTLAKIA